MNELEAEVSFLRGVIAKRERICLVATCKKTFSTNKVYAHIRKATDAAHQRAAATFEFWCLRCSIPFSRECDLNRHLTVSHSKEKLLHETTDFYNQKSTPQSKLPSKSISKVIPATAHNGLLEDAPTGKAEPEKESEEDRHKEEEEQDESISDSSNNPETDSPGSQYRTAIYATRQAASVYGMAPKNYGSSREGDKSALKAMQGVFSINKSDSIPGEQHITNSQLAQHGTTPPSVDVPADSGTGSVLEGHHRANFYLSQHRIALNSVEVPVPSKSREFSNPAMMTNWYEKPPTSDWQDLQNPAMMDNWCQNQSRAMEGGGRAGCASDGDEKEGARGGASRHADQHGAECTSNLLSQVDAPLQCVEVGNKVMYEIRWKLFWTGESDIDEMGGVRALYEAHKKSIGRRQSARVKKSDWERARRMEMMMVVNLENWLQS